MKKRICKRSFSIGGNYNKIWFFQEGKEYYYDNTYHIQEFRNSTLQTKIYCVYCTSDVEIPFTELKFKDKFDDRIEEREEKITQILS